MKVGLAGGSLQPDDTETPSDTRTCDRITITECSINAPGLTHTNNLVYNSQGSNLVCSVAYETKLTVNRQHWSMVEELFTVNIIHNKYFIYCFCRLRTP